MRYRYYIALLSGILFLLQQGFAQVDGSVRVRVFSGGAIDFVFNSMSKYTTGITYTNYTILGIEATDPAGNDNHTAWRIELSAEDSDGNGLLDGTNPANTLPFGTIEVQVTSVASCVPVPCPITILPAGPPGPWVALSAVPVPIIDGSNAVGADDIIPGVSELAYTTDQVNISYRAGVAISLLGANADYYSDVIQFDIYITPPF